MAPTSFYTRDLTRTCPSCGKQGDLDYLIVPPSMRAFTVADGEQYFQNYDETKDYACRNCGCEFILVSEP